MLIGQWILEITDILMYKIVSFWKKSVIKKNFARHAKKFLPPPPSQNRSYGLASYPQSLSKRNNSCVHCLCMLWIIGVKVWRNYSIVQGVDQGRGYTSPPPLICSFYILDIVNVGCIYDVHVLCPFFLICHWLLLPSDCSNAYGLTNIINIIKSSKFWQNIKMFAITNQ